MSKQKLLMIGLEFGLLKVITLHLIKKKKLNTKVMTVTGKKLGDNDYKFCKKRSMTSLLIRKIKD